MAVYCMSGTGNSYYVAKILSEKLCIEMKNVIKINPEDSSGIIDKDDYVGFIFPVYDFKAHKEFMKRIKKVNYRDDAYIFAVATYGVGTLGAYKKFKSEMDNSERKLDAGFSVLMPHNAVGSGRLSDADIDNILKISATDLERTISFVENKKTGDYMTTNLFDCFKSKYARKMLPAIPELIKELVSHGPDSLKFIANNNCKGCEACTNICPMHNISMKGGKPEFGNNCLSCFACVQWCSTSAISFGGKKLGTRKYTHPDVSIGEMINFNK